MGKLIKMKVLIYGLNGLGAEVAKNLILAGPKEVMLLDNTICKISDMASNFYITEKHVSQGISRAEATRPDLEELNQYVTISSLSEEINETVIQNYDTIVVCQLLHTNILSGVNNYCRNNDKTFIFAITCGLVTNIFTDFGSEFTITDKDGENIKSAVITSITKDTPGLITVHDAKRHDFNDGDFVVFREIEGMTELNICEPLKINNTTAYTFTIDDTSKFNEYKREGVVAQIKVPMTHTHESLDKRLVYPVGKGE